MIDETRCLENCDDIILVVVGNDRRPATREDAENIKKVFKAFDDGSKHIITHHSVDVQKIKIPKNKINGHSASTLVWKVGTDQRPATPEDINESMKLISEGEKSKLIITHIPISVTEIKR
jgi:hypothetical protein